MGALDFHLGGRLLALRKAGSGLRPLACGSVLRRLVGKGVRCVAGGTRSFRRAAAVRQRAAGGG
eukprot:7531137-Alexandrium_andersonii.AAC.1